MNESRTVINLEETIGKQVGRRKPPADPLRVADSTIQRAIDYQRAFPSRMPKRGVYRFHKVLHAIESVGGIAHQLNTPTRSRLRVFK